MTVAEITALKRGTSCHHQEEQMEKRNGLLAVPMLCPNLGTSRRLKLPLFLIEHTFQYQSEMFIRYSKNNFENGPFKISRRTRSNVHC